MTPPGRFVYGAARFLALKLGTQEDVLKIDVFASSAKTYYIDEQIKLTLANVITPTMDGQIIDCEKIIITHDEGGSYAEPITVLDGIFLQEVGIVEILLYAPGPWVDTLLDSAKAAGVLT